MSIKNVTKFKIEVTCAKVFEAIVDPQKISNFWFSKSSSRWEVGKTISLEYLEYGVEGFEIKILEVIPNQKIVYKWGEEGEESMVTMNFTAIDATNTILEVTQVGWDESMPNLIDELLGNKEGWVYMLLCLKVYLENGITTLRTGLL